jgi:apolipoprotein N-acyltransferase
VVERDPRRRRAALRGLLLALVALWLFGAYRLGSASPAVGQMRVGLVQAAIPQDEKWDAALGWRNVRTHTALTRRAAAQGARLIVWPESAVPFYYDSDPAVATELSTLARERGIFLLFGNDDRDGGTGLDLDRVLVGAKLVDPTGTLAFRYHKMRLVPFGEYVPLDGWLEQLGVKKLVQEVGSFTPGRVASVAGIEGRRLGVTICYEAIFPDLVRQFSANGAELLVNITNDAWYGRTSAPYQHFAMARLRAVENGRFLVRAANTGISAVVDPRGRVLSQTGLFERTTLVRSVSFVAERTWYARFGDVFAFGCLGCAALVTASTLRR